MTTIQVEANVADDVGFGSMPIIVRDDDKSVKDTRGADSLLLSKPMIQRFQASTSRTSTFDPCPRVVEVCHSRLQSREDAQAYAGFYGECHIRAIPLSEAAQAEQSVREQHHRWWIKNDARRMRPPPDNDDADDVCEKKEAEREDAAVVTDDGSKDTASQCRSESQRGFKRRRRRAGGDVSSGAVETSNMVEGKSGLVRLRPPGAPASADVIRARSDLLSSLTSSGGNVSDPAFLSALSVLKSYYTSIGHDARPGLSSGVAVGLDGIWLSVTRPTYVYNGCLGQDDEGRYLHTLGRMSFDMFRPTNIKCAVEGIMHVVEPVADISSPHFPRSLRRELKHGSGNEGNALRTYNIVVAFVIEPHQNRRGEPRPEGQQTCSLKESESASMKKIAGESYNQQSDDGDDELVIRRPMKGFMTNHGFILPDPRVPNRFSVWFTSGSLEANLDEDNEEVSELNVDNDTATSDANGENAVDDLLGEWRRVFDPSTVPRRNLRERAHVLAARAFLGAVVPDTMEEDGMMSYHLRRPIGGHGRAYIDILYLDEELRVLRGHRGQLYVCVRGGSSTSATAEL